MGFLSGLFHSREGKNIIMTGNPGTGKTHTAIGSCRFVLCIKIYMPNQYFL